MCVIQFSNDLINFNSFKWMFSVRAKPEQQTSRDMNNEWVVMVAYSRLYNSWDYCNTAVTLAGKRDYHWDVLLLFLLVKVSMCSVTVHSGKEKRLSMKEVHSWGFHTLWLRTPSLDMMPRPWTIRNETVPSASRVYRFWICSNWGADCPKMRRSAAEKLFSKFIHFISIVSNWKVILY